MRKRGPVQESRATLRQGQQDLIGKQTDQQQRKRCQQQHQRGTEGHVGLVGQFVVMRLSVFIGVFLPEQADVELEHVGGG